jgi:hypothetical protein
MAAAAAVQAQPSLIWGIDPTNSTGQGELLNIDPSNGNVIQGFSLPGISSTDDDVGLAGWTDELFYINGDDSLSLVTVIDPADGTTNRTFNISGGWFVTGLGYWAGPEGSWLYSCGCEVGDMHRYVAADGSSPEFFWSTVFDSKAVAGDNGGRIFSFARANSQDPDFDIYEIDPLVNTGPLNSFAAPSQTIRGMAFDGQYLYASDTSNNLFTQDPNSGTLLNTVQLGYTLWALASTEGSPMPEPGSLVLISIGLAGVGFMRRRRRSS